jgi:subtilisin family serine protease
LDAGIGDDNNPIPTTGSILVGATRFAPLENIRISNGGCRVVVYAPGDLSIDVTCGLPDNGYVPGFGGTSSAVAKVAGVAALMLEKNPTLTHHQVRDIMSRSQIRVVDNSSNPVGVLLDADQAVSAACHPVENHY